MKTIPTIVVMLICVVAGAYTKRNDKPDPIASALVGGLIMFIFLLGRWSVIPHA